MLAQIGLYFYDYLAASTVLLLGTFALWKFLRQPVARLMLARWTLYALLLLAVLCALPGRMPLGISLAEPIVIAEAEPVVPAPPVPLPGDFGDLAPDFQGDVREIFVPPEDFSQTMSPEPSGQERSISPAVCLAVIQGSGFALILGRLLLGCFYASRLCRKAMPLRNDKSYSVLESEGITAPVVLGIFRPKILLPVRLAETGESFRLALEHELAHVRHGDLRMLGLWQLLLPLLVLQPLFWIFKSLLRREQEFLVDAAVAESTGLRDRYAEELLHWAKVNREKPRHLVSMLGLASMVGIVEHS